MKRAPVRAWIVPTSVVALACAAAGAARLDYLAYERDSRARVERGLAAVAELEGEQIAEWRQLLLDDAQSLLAHPYVRAALQRVAGGAPRPDDVDHVAASLRSRLTRLRLSSASFLAADGRVLAATWPRPRASAAELGAAERARRDGAARLDPVPGESGRFLLALPVPGGPEGAAPVVLFDGYIGSALPRAVRAWPAASPSGELLFGALDGDGGLFVEALRHVSGQAVPERLPPDAGRWPLARAALGERGAGTALDYRGVPVVVAWRPVPGAPWGVVAKVDEEELRGPAARRGRQLAGALAALVLAGAAVAAAWARAERRDLDRRARELEARAVRQRLDYVWANANDLVLVADLEARLVDANDRALAAFGFGRGELAGLRLDDLLAPEADADRAARWRAVRERGGRIEVVCRRRDGSTFPAEVAAQVIEVEGRPLVFSLARDVSERKQVERLARLQGALLRHLSDAVVAADRELRVTAWTGAAERVYGRAAAQALGRPVPEALGCAATGEELAERRARVDAGDIVRFSDTHRRADGRPIDAEVTWVGLRDDGGGLVGYLLVSRDATEQRRLQAQLVFADRLASIGTLAAGVAHEINNPLSYLLANFEFLEERMGAGRGGDALAAVREARDGARRIAEIVRGLRTFSRRDAPEAEPGPADVEAAVRAAVRIAEGQLRTRARLAVELGGVPPVRASEHELAQVALNLLVNAGQAIPPGRAAEQAVRVATRVAPDGRVALEVSDTGGGIPAERLTRIFDPFFTTKPVGEGSGLGLSICHGIVEALGGEIQVESTVGRGSTFRVFLPAAAAPAAARRAAPAAAAPHGRVLVIDDEPLVGRAVARVLAREHEVVALTDPAEALARAAGGEPFDLVICDLMMPGMSGMECYEALHTARPELARGMIFLTGGAFAPEARAFLERVSNARVEKPFDADELRRAVASGVQRSRAA